MLLLLRRWAKKGIKKGRDSSFSPGLFLVGSYVLASSLSELELHPMITAIG
jgi:hypothetical protein